MDDIQKAIPHREPFLFVDRIIEISKEKITAELKVKPEFDFFKGHYPDFPIMPGVLVCESIFQAGAILLSKLLEAENSKANDAKVPVLTRIKNSRFKKMIRPDDTIQLTAEITDRIDDLFHLKGKAFVDGKMAVAVEYACALTPKPEGMK